jgi:hypothetical protein
MVTELRKHIADCPSCADLSRRLGAFHYAIEEENAPVKRESVWEKAQPRLDRWMRGYLKSQREVRGPGRQAWRFPSLSWGLPLAFAGTAAAIAVVLVVAIRHGGTTQQGVPDQLASVPAHVTNGAPAVSGRSSDKTLLMNNGKAAENTGPGGADPESLTLASADWVKLWVTTAALQPDGSYQIEGTLMPVAPGEDTLDSAAIAGTWTHAQEEDHLSLYIDQAAKGKSYYRALPSGGNDRIEAVTPPLTTRVPQVNQTIEVQIVHGLILHKAAVQEKNSSPDVQ